MKMQLSKLLGWCCVVAPFIILDARGSDLYIFSSHSLYHFDGGTGGFLGNVGTYDHVYGGGLQLGPDGLLHSLGDSGLWRIDTATGTGQEYVHFFSGGSPVTATPGGFALAPNGALYIFSNHTLLQFDGGTGSFAKTVGTYNEVYGGALQLGPDGLIYSLGDSGLWRIDSTTGAAQELVHFFSGGSPVTATPRGFAFGSDGGLYIFSSRDLLQFDGRTGSFVGTVGTYNQVYGDDLQLGPDGLLHALGDSGLWRIDATTGNGQEYVHFFSDGSPVTATPGGFVIVPEPSTLVFFVFALVSLAMRCRNTRRSRRSAA